MFLKTQYEMGKTFICTSADISGTYALEIETLQVMGATISIYRRNMESKKIKEFVDEFISKHKCYRLVDIIIDYYSVIKTAHVGLILSTEVEKKNFYINYYDKCTYEFQKEMKNRINIDIQNLKYSILSIEEIVNKYDGNIYYAMK